MTGVRSGAQFWLRTGILTLASVSAVLVMSTDPADARRRRHKVRHGVSHSASYSPPFSSIVVDANSGKVMDSNAADGLRHPASLTKIMTLYLLFERLEAGKISLDTQMEVSEHASEQAPTKLGLRPGQSLRVEDAIKGLVTKSANDAAVVVAETLGGSETNFASMMTRKARALGMSKTLYRNASGLPNDEQVTTARDQATLGRAIQERFPKYYRYFSTEAFRYRGNVMRNHNHLLGNVEGVDGIKTGYTRASGFNLVTSVRRGNRHIVAVVLGGRSGGSRDAKMRQLIAEYIDDASSRRTAPMIAEAREAPQPVAASRQPDAPVELASAAPMPIARPEAARKPEPEPMTSGVIESSALEAPQELAAPIKPVRVKTVAVRMKPTRVASANSMAPITTEEAAPPARTASIPAPRPVAQQRSLPPVAANHGIGQGILGVLPANAYANTRAQAPMEPLPITRPAHSPFPSETIVTTEQVQVASAAPVAVMPEPRMREAAQPKPQVVHSGWIVQVGAFDNEAEARQRIDAARSQAKHLLGSADPFTEQVSKGDKKLYRARFAGLERDQAENVCRQLKRSEIGCFTIKN